MCTNRKIHTFQTVLEVLLLTFSIYNIQQVLADTTDLSVKIDVLANTLLKQLRIPGLALSVVKDGEVIKSLGYGLRNIKAKQPCTKETLFLLGSLTKSMTAMMIVKHFHENGISLDTPLRKILGNNTVVFSDSYRTNHISMRDLLTHRTGIQSSGLIIATESIKDRDDLINRIRYNQEETPFRTMFRFSSDMYLVAGWVLEQITHKKWEQLIYEDILTPLNMTRSMTTAEFVQKYNTSTNFATSYYRSDTKSKILATVDMKTVRRVDAFNPAGGIMSTAEDMAKYVQCFLNNGKGVLQEGSMVEMFARGIPIMKQKLNLQDNYSEYFYGYALALLVGSVKDTDVLYHDGGWTRQRSAMRLYPLQNIGIFSALQDPDYISGTALNTMLQNGIYMLITEGKYPSELFTLTDSLLRQSVSAMKAATPPPVSVQNLTNNIRTKFSLMDYAGVYGNLINGNMTISLIDNQLTASLGWLSGPLIPITRVTAMGIFELDYKKCPVYFEFNNEKMYLVFRESTDNTKKIQFVNFVLQNQFVRFERDLKLHITAGSGIQDQDNCKRS